jgi:16S rRNA (guanine527-N7)-methyltransferase
MELPAADPRLSDDLIRSTLLPYWPHINEEQSRKINIYLDLLLFWNKRISLTSIDEPTETLRFHFGESLFALELLNFDEGRLADVGSGAGFPGLAIKIFCPQLHVTLLEPNRKKCVFLAEVVRKLELTDVNVIPQRFEDFSPGGEPLDFVTSRALGKVTSLLRWSGKWLRLGGHIGLWLSSDQLSQVVKSIGWEWKPCQAIPGTRKRKILIGIKTS